MSEEKNGLETLLMIIEGDVGQAKMHAQEFSAKVENYVKNSESISNGELNYQYDLCVAEANSFYPRIAVIQRAVDKSKSTELHPSIKNLRNEVRNLINDLVGMKKIFDKVHEVPKSSHEDYLYALTADADLLSFAGVESNII